MYVFSLTAVVFECVCALCVQVFCRRARVRSVTTGTRKMTCVLIDACLLPRWASVCVGVAAPLPPRHAPGLTSQIVWRYGVRAAASALPPCPRRFQSSMRSKVKLTSVQKGREEKGGEREKTRGSPSGAISTSGGSPRRRLGRRQTV